ncbi:DNA-invertase hin [uncultured bacterium]|nr:DNA-invertase hin [uncultured bacterium]
MKIGYARVSSAGQNLDTQKEKLNAFGCEKLYLEKQSGKSSDNRPELKKALDFAREGDIFVITRLDRLARSLLDLVKIVESFEKEGIGFVVLDQQIDTTTPTGRLMFHVLSAIGEFERELINERVKDGISKAKDKGVRFGRKAKLTPEQLIEFKREFESPPEGMTKTDIAKKYGLGRSSGYRLQKVK